ncbi:hypothetical protein PTTG_28722, partial [Puccinia triticina 1-1 BBBD Race 1]
RELAPADARATVPEPRVGDECEGAGEEGEGPGGDRRAGRGPAGRDAGGPMQVRGRVDGLEARVPDDRRRLAGLSLVHPRVPRQRPRVARPSQTALGLLLRRIRRRPRRLVELNKLLRPSPPPPSSSSSGRTHHDLRQPSDRLLPSQSPLQCPDLLALLPLILPLLLSRISLL